MPETLDPLWQLDCLTSLARQDAELVQSALHSLWQQFPGLHREVVVRAVARKKLSSERGAQMLNLDVAEVTTLVKQKSAVLRTALVECEEGRPARLPDCRLPVWEVVRKHRELGSPEATVEYFPGLGRCELEAALAYAEANAEEVDALIDQYESYCAQRAALVLN